MPSLRKWAVVVGCVLACVFLVAVRHKADRSFFIDSKAYFAAARVFLHGQNPYDGPAVVQESLALDPAGFPAGTQNERYINLPAALLPEIAVSFVPWRLFTTLCILITGLCLPLIVILAAELFGLKLTPARLVAGSVVLAAFPPVWRGVMTGQSAVILVAISLGLCLAVSRGRRGVTAGLAFLALMKATCCVPLIGYLFFKAHRRERVAIVTGCAAFALASVVMAVIIGPHAALDGFRQSQAAMFNPGGANDPYVYPARYARVDLAPMLTLAVDAHHIGLANALAGALLLLPAIWLLTIRRSRSIEPAEICVWLTASLLVFYHRPYDVVFAVPILALGMRDLRDGRRLHTAARLGAVALSYTVLGDHSIMSVVHFDAPWIRPAITIILYLSCVIPALVAIERPVATDVKATAVV